jgi:hypothetical protein
MVATSPGLFLSAVTGVFGLAVELAGHARLRCLHMMILANVAGQGIAATHAAMREALAAGRGIK